MKINIAFILMIASAIQLSAQTFTLSSQDLGGQATMKQVFEGFGCTGDNVSPQLSWKDAPSATQSFAITMYDPDAPTGSGWWHWLVFDIPTNVHELATGAGSSNPSAMPAGAIQSITDYGTTGFGGPCPPEGDGPHQYIITVHALKVKSLGLDANTNAAVVGYYLNSQTLAKASIVAYYER